MNLKPTKAFVAVLALLAVLLPAGGAQAQVYASPTGSDAAAGTLAAPVKTPQQAQTLARQQITSGQQGAAGITVYLRGGTYSLAAPLALTAADSGETWTAYNGEAPTLSGGLVVTGWTLHDSGKNIWQATAPASLDTRTLYVNGVRCFRAHSADASVLGTLTQTGTGYTSNANGAAAWGNPSAIEFVYNRPGVIGTAAGSHWTESRVPVASMTGAAITMQTPAYYEAKNQCQVVPTQSGNGGTDPIDLPGYVENAYELLSAATPGQFYLDKSAHILYYVPRQADNMATALVVAPALEADVTVTGAANVTLSGLTFADTTWLTPNSGAGFPELQTGVYFNYPSATQNGLVPFGQFAVMPAAVRVSGGSGITVKGCKFQRIGAGGLSLMSGTAGDTVQGNLFTDISGYGICLASILDWKTTAPVSHVLIDDNAVHDIGLEFHGEPGIIAFTAQNCTISHNLVYNVPYSGIAWGVGWVNALANPSVSQGNVVAYNHVYNIMQNRVDGGSIYVNGSNPGLQITGNLVHGQNSSNGPNVIYLDNGNGPNTLLQGNVAYASAGSHFSDGDSYGGSLWQYNFTDGQGNIGAYPPAQNSDGPPSPLNSLMKETVGVSGSAYPASVVSQAGLLPAFRALAAASAQVTPLQGDGAAAAAGVNPGLGAPASLILGTIQGNSVGFAWSPPATKSGVSVGGYDVFASGLLVGSTAATSWVYDDLAGGVPVSLTVRAYDAHGAVGAASPPLVVTPPAALAARTSYPTYKP